MTSQPDPGLANLKAGILIGGSSSRMGRPKQLLELGGKTLLDYALRALTSFSEISVIGKGPLPQRHSSLPRIDDAQEFVGPLAGIIGALRSDPTTASWLIVACDQPWLSTTAIQWLMQQRRPNSIAIMPHDASGVQPFPGVYEAAFLATLNDSAANNHNRGISSFAELTEVHSPPLPRPLRGAWASINSQGELRDALVGDDHIGA